jgi:hypothetical protein
LQKRERILKLAPFGTGLLGPTLRYAIQDGTRAPSSSGQADDRCLPPPMKAG